MFIYIENHAATVTVADFVKFVYFRNRPKQSALFEGKTRLNLGVIHVGAPCCGMNAAVRSFVRNCIISGKK